jgi:hypothetical protein
LLKRDVRPGSILTQPKSTGDVPWCCCSLADMALNPATKGVMA